MLWADPIKKSVMATADTTLLDAWMAREDVFDAFLAYNHAFKEFNRVLRGEEIAATLTLGDVAVMAHSPVEDLVAIANGSDPEPAPTLPMQGDEERPAWMDGIDLTGVVTVDTRPIFESGHELRHRSVPRPCVVCWPHAATSPVPGNSPRAIGATPSGLPDQPIFPLDLSGPGGAVSP